jgi:hypothetical protein
VDGVTVVFGEEKAGLAFKPKSGVDHAKISIHSHLYLICLSLVYISFCFIFIFPRLSFLYFALYLALHLKVLKDPPLVGGIAERFIRGKVSPKHHLIKTCAVPVGVNGISLSLWLGLLLVFHSGSGEEFQKLRLAKKESESFYLDCFLSVKAEFFFGLSFGEKSLVENFLVGGRYPIRLVFCI